MSLAAEINWDDPTTRQYLTGAVARRLPGEARRCFYVLNSTTIPVLVHEDQGGYRAMRGETPAGTWDWGPTPEAAWRICDLVNAELFGITREEAARIVGASLSRTPAQERILAEVRAAGPLGKVYTGRSGKALAALERDGLIATTRTFTGTGARISVTLPTGA